MHSEILSQSLFPNLGQLFGEESQTAYKSLLERVLLFTRKFAEGNFGRVVGEVMQEINNDANYKLENQLWVNLLGYVISAPWEMHKLGVSRRL